MITDRQAAKHISELMLDIFSRIEQSVKSVRRDCPKDEAEKYLLAVGKVAGAIVIDVLEPLYKENPDLKPPDWGP